MINYSSTSVTTITAANSYTWPVNNVTYTQAGTYTANLLNSNGCDSSLTLQLQLISISIQVDQNVSCHGAGDGSVVATAVGSSNNFLYDVDGANLYTNSDGILTSLSAGTHTICAKEISSNVIVCDTVLITQPDPLTVTLTIDSLASCLGNDGGISAAINGGTTDIQPYLTYWSPNVVTNSVYDMSVTGLAPGTYTLMVEDDNSCFASASITVGSVVPLTLSATFAPILCHGSTTTVNAVGAGGSGNITTSISGGAWNVGAGTYTVIATDEKGCTAESIVVITEPAGLNDYTTQVACNTFTWGVNNQTYTASGIYTETFTSVLGCDSTYVLNLTINNSVNSTTTATNCNSYSWNGATYTTSGIYNNYSTNGVGCIDTATLNLTINFSNNSMVAQTSCNSYTWNGNTYTTSGAYYHYATGTSGCADTSTLLLTINNSLNTVQSQTACNSYTWNGNTYTSNGTYYYYTNNNYGCQDTAILNLTLTHSNNTLSFAMACNSHSWYGNIYSTSGTYYHYSTGGNGCADTATLMLTVNYASSSITNIVSGGSYTWNANNVTYSVSGVYSATLTNAANCDSILTLNLTIAGVTVAPKVFLNGPYVAADGLMHDSLRSQGLIPSMEPYTGAPLNKPNIADNIAAEHIVSPAVLSVTGSNAIVDWVLVELRSASNPAIIVATKRALLQRDGDVVSSVDGISPLYFAMNAPGSYYVSIKHRNHLGVMSASPMSLSMASTTVDFTTLAPVYVHVATPPITNAPRKTLGTVSLLWAGDANANKNVKYNGLTNDKEPILNAVGVATPNNTVYGYRLEDVNMDGMVRYNNLDNDKNYILNSTVGVSTPNIVISQHTPN